MTTAKIAEPSRRRDGGRAGHALVMALVAFLLALSYSLVATGTARADGSTPASDPLANGVPETTADAAGAGVEVLPSLGSPSDQPAPGDGAVPAGTEVQASTDQAAAASAAATQEQPKNLVVSVRSDSPGDDGPITQQNSAAATGSASNGATTAQGGEAAGGPAGSVEAATEQAALGTAAAAQQQAQNIVIIIRINSPGNDGPITQTNTAAASAAAANDAATTQGGSTGGGLIDAGAGTVPDPRVPIGPPAQQGSTVPTAGAPAPAPVVEQAQAGPRTAFAGRSLRRPTSGRGSLPSTAPRVARESMRPAGKQSLPARQSPPLRRWHAARSAAPVAPGARRPPVQPKPSSASASAHGPASAGVNRRAVDLLGSLARPPSLEAGEKAKEVSSAVVYTLIAVLLAAAFFLVSTFRPAGLRVIDPRTWRHG